MIYDIANLRIAIQNKYPFTSKLCENYLSDDQTSPVHLSVSVTEEELSEEREKSEGFSEGYIENICLYRALCKRLPVLNRFLMHCSVLSYDGNGYAFLGRSGTGKSTHTKLWLKTLPDTKIINGDKPILEYKNGEFIVYGTPWMGKEQWGENASVPLKGLCFLEQAKENSIQRLSHKMLTRLLFAQLLIPEEEDNVVATLNLADKLITTVPAYLLQCDISEDAVKTSFEKMTGFSFEEKKK